MVTYRLVAYFYICLLLTNVISLNLIASLAVVLNTAKKLANDEYSIALRATHNRPSQYFAFSTLLTNQLFKWRCKKKECDFYVLKIMVWGS